MEKINAKQMQETVLHGLNTAGNKIVNFATAVGNNFHKVVLVPAVAGALAVGGHSFANAEKGIAQEHLRSNEKYEQTVDEIAKKRGQFIATGANKEILEIFDEQNPAPQQPQMRETQSIDRIKYGAAGMLLGGAGGAIAGTAASVLNLGVLGVGAMLTAFTANRKKEEEIEMLR